MSNKPLKNMLYIHIGYLGMFLTSVTQHKHFPSVLFCVETSICSTNCLTFVSCLGTPQIHFPNVSVFCKFSVLFVSSHQQDCGLFLSLASHLILLPTLVKQSLSILLPDLIMSVVSESVASLESHGRQLHSEVGHMVRWVTRADSNRPRDGQRDQAAVSTLHFINTGRARELGGYFQESAVRKGM